MIRVTYTKRLIRQESVEASAFIQILPLGQGLHRRVRVVRLMPQYSPGDW